MLDKKSKTFYIRKQHVFLKIAKHGIKFFLFIINRGRYILNPMFRIRSAIIRNVLFFNADLYFYFISKLLIELCNLH